MENINKTRRNIIKKAYVVPTIVLLGDLSKPAFAAGSDVRVPGNPGVCEWNPDSPACR